MAITIPLQHLKTNAAGSGWEGVVVGWFVAEHYRHFMRQPDRLGGSLHPLGSEGCPLQEDLVLDQ